MTNEYVDMKAKHAKNINSLPMFFAFSQEQFKEGMEKFGLKATDTAQVCRIPAGGIIKKTDKKLVIETFLNHTKEMKEAIDADKTGEGFITEMFKYELINHEYCYTSDPTDTLEALGLTEEEVYKSKTLSKGLELGIAQAWLESC